MKLILMPELERLRLLMTATSLPDYTTFLTQEGEQAQATMNMAASMVRRAVCSDTPAAIEVDRLPVALCEKANVKYLQTMALVGQPPLLEMFSSSDPDMRAKYDAGLMAFNAGLTKLFEDYLTECVRGPTNVEERMRRYLLLNNHRWMTNQVVCRNLWPAKYMLPYMFKGPLNTLNAMVANVAPALTEVRFFNEIIIRLKWLNNYFSLHLQWISEIDNTSQFQRREKFQSRISIGPFDSVVEHYASKYVPGKRKFIAKVCATLFDEMRGGLFCLTNAINLRPLEVWNKAFEEEHAEYAVGGSEWVKVKKCLFDLRAHVNDNTQPKPSDEDSELLIFVIKALEQSCHPGWKSVTQQSYADGTDASRLIERYVSFTKATGGSAAAWLTDPAVYVPARETFGGIFHQSGTFDFADGRTERENVDFPSIVDDATATGSGSLQNIHVLLGQSMVVEASLGAKMIQLRDLINDIGGVPGPGGSPNLPGPIYKDSIQLLQVRCLN